MPCAQIRSARSLALEQTCRYLQFLVRKPSAWRVISFEGFWAAPHLTLGAVRDVVERSRSDSHDRDGTTHLAVRALDVRACGLLWHNGTDRPGPGFSREWATWLALCGELRVLRTGWLASEAVSEVLLSAPKLALLECDARVDVPSLERQAMGVAAARAAQLAAGGEGADGWEEVSRMHACDGAAAPRLPPVSRPSSCFAFCSPLLFELT